MKYESAEEALVRREELEVELKAVESEQDELRRKPNALNPVDAARLFPIAIMVGAGVGAYFALVTGIPWVVCWLVATVGIGIFAHWWMSGMATATMYGDDHLERVQELKRQERTLRQELQSIERALPDLASQAPSAGQLSVSEDLEARPGGLTSAAPEGALEEMDDV